MPTPQENAKLEQIKRNWQQKRQITDRFATIKTKIGVYSGKGGVGKTTVAVNLAATLAKQGAKVGLLDVDIDCPNVNKVLGITEPPEYVGGEIHPSERWGVKVVSMAFFQENEEEAIIWRGPMIHKIMQEFIRNVAWGELDYLVMDLPPGTGDTQLTLVQTVPIAGAVIVTTPQELSLMDARKGLIMFERVEVPVLGIVENMSYFSCPHCTERTDIFATGGGKSCAEELGVDLLAEIPLIPAIRECSDEGTPIVVAQPDSEATQIYNELAGKVAAKLSVLALTKIDLPVIQ
ncbi:MAG: Mrp/NBP35 family ATP-binding protein [Nitrospinae bacterium]|nr:Mrp/NBP35 family ATP-binding protein [Nitrospinota bacterium]